MAAETVKWTKLIVSLGWVCVVAVRPSALLNCRQLLQILKSKSKHRDYLLATSPGMITGRGGRWTDLWNDSGNCINSDRGSVPARGDSMQFLLDDDGSLGFPWEFSFRN